MLSTARDHLLLVGDGGVKPDGHGVAKESRVEHHTAGRCVHGLRLGAKGVAQQAMFGVVERGLAALLL